MRATRVKRHRREDEHEIKNPIHADDVKDLSLHVPIHGQPGALAIWSLVNFNGFGRDGLSHDRAPRKMQTYFRITG